jgi:HEAT repeat protein
MADDPRPLVDSLLEDLNSTDAELRSYVALALGWEGNHRAVDALIDRLDDQDEFVQQAAVNALSNLQTDRAYDLMLERLAQGRPEHKRAILFALWRFHSRRDEVAALYKEQLEMADDELRFDAFVLLGRVTDTREQIPFYRYCLEDRDPRVREKALEKLAELGPGDLSNLKPEIEAMLSDPQVRVQQAAIRVLKRMGPAGR